MSRESIFIRFTPEQAEVILRIGAKRQEAKAAHLEKKRADRDGANLHVMGFAAEAALAVLLSVKPDTRIMVKGTEGVSLRAHGWAWSTKWIREPFYDLRYVAGQVPVVNAMVLCRGTLPTVELVGWTTRETFLRGYEVTNFGRGDVWVYSQKSLLPMSALFEADALAGLRIPGAVLAMQELVRTEREAARAAKHPTPPPLPDLFNQPT